MVTVTVEGGGVVTGTVEVIDGAAVELGFGPPRRVGATVIDTSTTITATVTVKSGGGPRSDRVWDVRVGSGVLVNGFTVQP